MILKCIWGEWGDLKEILRAAPYPLRTNSIPSVYVILMLVSDSSLSFWTLSVLVIPKLAILTLSLLNISNTISLNYFAFPFSNINFSHLFSQIKTEGEVDMTAPRPTLISEMLAPPQPPPQSQPPPAQPPQSVTSTSAPMSGKVQS